MLAELVHATIAVGLLSILVAAIYLTFTDLPLAPFLTGRGDRHAHRHHPPHADITAATMIPSSQM